MKRKSIYSSVGVALFGVLLTGASTTQLELYNKSVPPQEASDSLEQDRLINELYSHYVDCLEVEGSEEVCYRKWSQGCKTLFPKNCSLLEDKMFPTPSDGDESC